MYRIIISVALLLLPGFALADALLQTMASQLQALSGAAQMLVTDRERMQLDIKKKDSELEWWRAYAKGFEPKSEFGPAKIIDKPLSPADKADSK